MCDPVSAIAIGSAALSAAGQINAGMQQKKLAKYQARAAEVEAQNATALAAEEESRTRRAGRRLLQDQRAQLAAAGLDPDAGSPLLLAVEAAEETELAALDARLSGRLASDERRRDATLRRAEGRLAFVNSLFGAVGTVGKAVGRRAAEAGWFDSQGDAGGGAGGVSVSTGFGVRGVSLSSSV